MIKIKKLKRKHWAEVAEIYQDGIDTKMATFRTDVPSWDSFNINHHPHSRFVAVENDIVLGWGAISPVSKRASYKGVAEVSVYVSLKHLKMGIGKILMQSLILSSENNSVWTLYSSLFPENIGSVNLHIKNNFRLIGRRERIAQLDGVWRDTVLYERRSEIIGN